MSLVDMFGAVVLLFAMIASIFISHSVVLQFHAGLNATTPGGLNENQTALFTMAEQSFGIMEEMISFVYVVGLILAIVLAFLIPTSPIFLPISILLWVFSIVFSMTFANIIWLFVESDATFLVIMNGLPVLVQIIHNLALIQGIVGTILVVVMYSKRNW